MSVALAAGAAGALVVGVPGVSGAQTSEAPTTTVPPAAEQEGTGERPGRGHGHGHGQNCPDKEGEGGAEGTSMRLRMADAHERMGGPAKGHANQ
ncbi:MAG: hypothetical protein AB1673_13170 [Actinomycetota bacterium]